MAIRRPPTTFSDTISTADIADDAITGGKLANDIAISTTGNIATTGSGTLTSAGAFTASGGIANAGTITAGTLGSNVVFPAGHIIQSVTSPTISNFNQTATASELGIMDVVGQITLSSSSNGVLVFFSAKIATNPSSSSYGKAFIRKGTISSLGTILCSQHFGANISSSVDHPLSLWGFDASPGETTPDYVLTIERNASTTTTVSLSQNTDITRCYLFEVKQ